MKDIEKFIRKTIHNNELVKIHDQLYLTREQMEILDFYAIPYRSCSSIPEILLLIEQENDCEELDEIAQSLQEFQYYHYTKK